MNSLISVCVPTFNGEKYLRESLECISNQTYQKLEILVVDDRSDDLTVEIVEEFAKEDIRIRLVINDSNLGLVANWNKCIGLAKGEWVKLHFQDDLMNPEAIEEMWRHANENNVSLVLTDREYFSNPPKDHFIKLPRVSDFTDQLILNTQDFIDILCKAGLKANFVGEPIIGLVRQDLFTKLGYFDEDLKQIVDLEFWLRLCTNEDFVFIPRRLHQFRVHNDSQTARNKVTKGVSVSAIDRVKLSFKILHHELFSSARIRGGNKLNRVVKGEISHQIRLHGYKRMHKVLTPHEFSYFNCNIINYCEARFVDFLFFLKIRF